MSKSKVRVRNGCDKRQKPTDFVQSGVPYENATPADVMAAFTVLSIEFYGKIELLFKRFGLSPQIEPSEGLRKSKKGTGAKRVRKRKPRPG